jgi:hypothetical protein
MKCGAFDKRIPEAPSVLHMQFTEVSFRSDIIATVSLNPNQDFPVRRKWRIANPRHVKGESVTELFVGAAVATGFWLTVQFTRRKSLAVRWWQWGLTVLGFIYLVFVAEVVVGFLREGTPKGAVVMGTMLGFVAVVWGVLLGRFVFRGNLAPRAESGEVSGTGGEHVA